MSDRRGGGVFIVKKEGRRSKRDWQVLSSRSVYCVYSRVLRVRKLSVSKGGH